MSPHNGPRRFFDFLIFSNLFLAFSVTSLVLETDWVLNNPKSNGRYPVFLFFATLFLYCFHRIYRSGRRAAAEKLAPRHRWVEANRFLFLCVLTVAASGTAVSVLFLIPLRTSLYLLPIGLLSLGYTVPFVPWKGTLWRLRDIPGIKILLISLVLGLTTVLLPVLSYTSPRALLQPQICFIFLRRIFFIFAITVPFDIRDMEYDRQQGTRTLPLWAGIRQSLLLAFGALAVFAGLALIQFFYSATLSLPMLMALLVSAFAAGGIIAYAGKERTDYYYSFFVEGTMLLQCLLIAGVHIYGK